MRPSTHSDIIIIGGGVAGLAAAGELGRRGLAVTLLEARNRFGGRVFTQRQRGWPAPIELGAEFIHGGNAPLWRFLKKHRITARKLPESHWRFADERMKRIADVTAEIEHVTDRIQPRKMEGWSFAEFMRRSAGALTAKERKLATDFVEGFQAAPTTRMSASAIAGESLDTSEQFAVLRGYDRLVASLVAEARQANVALVLASPVSTIHWQRGAVAVQSAGKTFAGARVLITLPLGVLQAKPRERGAVTFAPRLRARQQLIAKMQVGHVIRLTLHLEPSAWARVVPAPLRRRRGGFGFIHSQVEGVPVWWSLSGKRVLTGWSGGPNAQALAARSPRAIFEKALSALSRIFSVRKTMLRHAVLAYATHNWSRDPFSRGAYSFIKAGMDNASEKLRIPIQDTLFFAGEATADGAEVGTVHGALASGLRAAQEIAAAGLRAQKDPRHPGRGARTRKRRVGAASPK